MRFLHWYTKLEYYKMKFLGTILILVWCVAQSKASGKTKNKKEEDSSEDKSNNELMIRYKVSNDDSTETYAVCKNESDSVLLGTPFKNEKSSKDDCLDDKINFVINLPREGNDFVPCGGKDRIKTGYRKHFVFFKFKINGNEYKLPSYHYCYDGINTKSMLYAYYDLDNPSLLNNKLLQTEQNYDFKMRIVTNPPSYSKDTKSGLLPYKIRTSYQSHEVAISAFVPFGHWRRSFYQSDNIAPINKDLVPAWTLLVDNIRYKISEMNKPLKIFSGVYDFIRIDGSVQYLPNSSTPIPEFWWIILYNKDKTQGVSLIMHNYSYGFGIKKLDPLCGKSICGDVGLQGAIPQGDGYDQASIYCCSASTIATKFDFNENDEMLKFPDEYATVLHYDDFYEDWDAEWGRKWD